MKLNSKIIITGLVIAAVLLAFLITYFVEPIDISNYKKQKSEEQLKGWNRSGPFAIDKYEYRFDENIFIVAENLRQTEKGEVIFVLPDGITIYARIPFDGAVKPEFSKYFTPQVSEARRICSTNEFIGQWTILFDGIDLDPILFKVLNDTTSGRSSIFENVC